MYKESVVLPHEPGGGGWGLQQLTLSNMYVQNVYLMNYWTNSNKGLNLCRYNGTRVKLYRQKEIDYIFLYDIEPPYNITKYYFASLHPMKLLQTKHKVIVPSLATLPHKRKPYVSKFIKPPKEMINKWYFQQNFANFPLVQFTAAAISLQSMFMSTKSINNNVSLFTINTTFFLNSCFHPPSSHPGLTEGYVPRPGTYLYGLQHASLTWGDTPVKNVTYLGNCELNDPGDPLGNTETTSYGYKHWGNPFFHSYLSGEFPMFISSKKPSELFSTYKDKKVSEIQPAVTWKHDPLVLECRYNPNYDRGDGNVAYWIRNDTLTRNNWDPLQDPILKIEGFPLWILLWGWEDFTKKLAEVQNIDENYLLVVQSKYLDIKQPHFVFLSESYINGQGPYDVPGDEINIWDRGHWYPKWRYQQEAINNLLMSGPGTCKAENQKSISAYMQYSSFFKWGGNPSAMENVYDPTAQPTYPNPSTLQITNEITDPNTNISDYIYDWDVRRDLLTQRATKRITNYPTSENSLFTDGTKSTTTDIPLQQFPTTTQKKTTKEEKEKALQLQLQQQQLHNQLLRQRLQQLTQIMDS